MKKQLMAGMMAASMALSLAACEEPAVRYALFFGERQCCQQRSLGSRQHQRRCLYQHRSFHFQR